MTGLAVITPDWIRAIALGWILASRAIAFGWILASRAIAFGWILAGPAWRVDRFEWEGTIGDLLCGGLREVRQQDAQSGDVAPVTNHGVAAGRLPAQHIRIGQARLQQQPVVGQLDIGRIVDCYGQIGLMQQLEMILHGHGVGLWGDGQHAASVTFDRGVEDLANEIEIVFSRVHRVHPITIGGGDWVSPRSRGYSPMNVRVYSSEGEDRPANPAAVTLRDAFRLYLLPSLDGRRAQSTIGQYRTAVHHWERFVAVRASSANTRAPESVPMIEPIDLVSEISDAMLNAWGMWLISKDGANLKLATAQKQWSSVRAILRRVGPREAGNARALGYLDRVPVMDPLGELVAAWDDEDDGPADLTDQQIDRIYDACDVARYPVEVPALQWRTYIVILAMMGPRVNDAATLTADNFQLEPKSPAKLSDRTHAHGWLIYRPTKTRRKKPARLIIPLPATVRAHIDALMRARSGRVFSWRDSKGDAFRAEWSKIVAQAGLPQVERRHFRPAANLRWGDLGRWVLGHAARDVNERHYLRTEPELLKACPSIPIPSRFASAEVPRERQTFFEF